jgi:hypothetical protein
MADECITDNGDDGSRQTRHHHPLAPEEAARIICAVHLTDDGNPIIGVSPDFSKVDGDLYRQAWRTLRSFAANMGSD